MERVLEKARLMLAAGQLGWEATLKVVATFLRRLRDRMATCDSNVVHCAASCTLNIALLYPPCTIGAHV